MRISDWGSDVCSSDLHGQGEFLAGGGCRDRRTRRRQPRDLLRRIRHVEQVEAAGDECGRAEGGYCEDQFSHAHERLSCPAEETGRHTESLDLEASRFIYAVPRSARSEEHTSELQSLMRISYAVFC